jgi:hypothetical protein
MIWTLTFLSSLSSLPTIPPTPSLLRTTPYIPIRLLVPKGCDCHGRVVLFGFLS